MSDIVKKSLKYSGLDSLMRSLNLAFQGHRLDLARYRFFFQVLKDCDSPKMQGTEYMRHLDAIDHELGESVRKMGEMGRKWEDVYVTLADAQAHISAFLNEAQTVLSPSAYDSLKERAQSLDAKMGIRAVATSLIRTLKQESGALHYCHAILGTLVARYPEQEELRENYQYIGDILTLVEKNTLPPVKRFHQQVKAIRWVHDELTLNFKLRASPDAD